ncbi:hypothetical protein LJ737_07785 [Hymenobacter sp. 15J16-1T3B]|uniref:hypothetical protein n=1 Tax=Hymenobacter sp. 15J16-1T3B TaxID=2886941 RepID=UPI001D10F8A6|nr:hypothetical protein [Hymenobacter sp. 15J16-1T3B]MCC3157135.1 hypothetical protein [Hymenobacter sp. 15J16-1T3B]
MNEFLAYVAQFGSLSPQQQSLLAHRATSVELRKGENFLEAGVVARRVGFVLNGILRVCYCTDQGEEITHYFLDEHRLLLGRARA